jgi:hypothetical protein
MCNINLGIFCFTMRGVPGAGDSAQIKNENAFICWLQQGVSSYYTIKNSR